MPSVSGPSARELCSCRRIAEMIGLLGPSSSGSPNASYGKLKLAGSGSEFFTQLGECEGLGLGGLTKLTAWPVPGCDAWPGRDGAILRLAAVTNEVCRSRGAVVVVRIQRAYPGNRDSPAAVINFSTSASSLRRPLADRGPSPSRHESSRSTAARETEDAAT